MRPRAIPGVANLADAIAAETVTRDFGSAILPAQHFASAREQRLMEAEHRLLLAVLEDAVRCYLSYARPRNQLQQIKLAEVRNWFSPPDGVVQEGLFTSSSICEFLGIEPKLFLSRLEAINISDLPPMRRQCARRLSLAEQRGARRRRMTRSARNVRLADDFVGSPAVGRILGSDERTSLNKKEIETATGDCA